MKGKSKGKRQKAKGKGEAGARTLPSGVLPFAGVDTAAPRTFAFCLLPFAF
jgi:hypothetical protein